MAEAKWSGVLSTTEPRNDVGIIKVRQGNTNSEIAEFQIVQNNKPYDLTGLTVYFCASFGLNLVEKPAVVVNATGGKIQYTFDDDSMQAVGRQKGYLSIKKAESKIDSTQDFEFQVDSSLMTRSIDGKSYIYKLSTLIKVLDDFIKNGQNNFNTWFDSVKEILYGVDPGGNILRELIEARKTSGGNIFASLKARLDKNEDDTAARLAQISTHFTDLGGIGDGVTDNTEAFKAFISKGGNLVVPEGTYMLKADFYEIVSNTNLFFINNATLKLLPHNASNYSILQCKGVDNVLVVKPRIDGSKMDNAAESGEWGHGIDILNSTRVKVIEPIISNTFGDGIYVGHDYYGTSLKETEDVDIIRPIIDGSRRNGVSICSGRRINVIRPTIKNITDVNPKAGIDIEPEGEGSLKPFLEHVFIDSPVFENCTVGIDHNLFNLMDQNLSVDIKIKNPTFINCSHPLMFRPLTGKLGGSISISKPVMRGTLQDVLHVDNYSTRDTPHVTIDRPEIYDFNLSGSQDEFYNHCFTFLKLSTTTEPVDIGNFTIIKPYIEDNNNGAFKLLFASAGEVKKIGNVKIINPEIKTTNILQNFVRNNPDLQIVDGLDSMVLKSPYFTHDIAQTLAAQVINPDASDWNTYTSTDANMPYGHKVKFRVVKNMRMTFRPTGGIVGYSGANKGIYSETVGSMIELIYLGKWYVENKTGEWVVET